MSICKSLQTRSPMLRCSNSVRGLTTKSISSRTPEIQRYSEFAQPVGYWTLAKNRWEFLLFLSKQLANQSGASGSNEHMYNYLYKATKATVFAAGGGALLHHYHRSSVPRLVMTECPDHNWEPWKFGFTPRTWWGEFSVAVSRKDPAAMASLACYIEDLANRLNIKTLDDWNRVSPRTINQDSIQRAISVKDALLMLYPNHPWSFKDDSRLKSSGSGPRTVSNTTKLDVFSSVRLPQSFWNEKENRIAYLDWLKNQLGGTYEDLYKVNYKLISRTGGTGLMTIYNNRAALAVMEHYIEHHWKPWKFRQSSRGWWSELASRFAAYDVEAEAKVREYLEDLASELKLNSYIELANYSISKLSPTTIKRIRHFGSLPHLIARLAPDANIRLATRTPRHMSRTKAQRLLFRRFNKILPT